MSYKQVTSGNFTKVVNEMVKQFRDADRDTKTVWANSLDDMLEELHNEDFFGTEGQNDPRGDHRD